MFLPPLPPNYTIRVQKIKPLLTGCIKRDTIDTSADLATLKGKFNATGTFTIPKEVYKKIAETLNANSEIKSIYTKYSKNEGKLIKQVAKQIGTLLKKMDDITVPVDEDGATVNYKVSFNGSGIGASESFISVSKGTKSVYKTIFGNSAFKTVTKEYTLSQIGELVQSVTIGRTSSRTRRRPFKASCRLWA